MPRKRAYEKYFYFQLCENNFQSIDIQISFGWVPPLFKYTHMFNFLCLFPNTFLDTLFKYFKGISPILLYLASSYFKFIFI